jgi:cobalt transporter subunit CbtA
MFRRVFFAAILAGIAASLVMSAVQHFRVTPYILAAEVYERNGHDHGHASSTVTPAPETHAWGPAEGFERTAYTVLANLLVSVAFALALAGVSLMLNLPITLANGALWGLSGFLVFALAPSAGLPPELPGMPGGELWTRQVWWWFTVVMTAGGLAVLARNRRGAHLAIAAVLIATPHVLGAPAAPSHETSVPAHLASGFVANALATAAVFWVVLGFAMGFVNERTSKETLTHDAA